MASRPWRLPAAMQVPIHLLITDMIMPPFGRARTGGAHGSELRPETKDHLHVGLHRICALDPATGAEEGGILLTKPFTRIGTGAYAVAEVRLSSRTRFF